LRLSSLFGLTDAKIEKLVKRTVIPLLEPRDLDSFHRQKPDPGEPHSFTRPKVHRHFVGHYRPKIPSFLVALHVPRPPPHGSPSGVQNLAEGQPRYRMIVLPHKYCHITFHPAVLFSDNVGVKHLHFDHSPLVHITHFIKINNNNNCTNIPEYSSGSGGPCTSTSSSLHHYLPVTVSPSVPASAPSSVTETSTVSQPRPTAKILRPSFLQSQNPGSTLTTSGLPKSSLRTCPILIGWLSAPHLQPNHKASPPEVTTGPPPVPDGISFVTPALARRIQPSPNHTAF